MRWLWDVVFASGNTEYASGHGDTMIAEMGTRNTHSHQPYLHVTGERLLEREVDRSCRMRAHIIQILYSSKSKRKAKRKVKNCNRVSTRKEKNRAAQNNGWG
jgi:hypothetical protein